MITSLQRSEVLATVAIEQPFRKAILVLLCFGITCIKKLEAVFVLICLLPMSSVEFLDVCLYQKPYLRTNIKHVNFTPELCPQLFTSSSRNLIGVVRDTMVVQYSNCDFTFCCVHKPVICKETHVLFKNQQNRLVDIFCFRHPEQ
jgi:hypothetical protein